METELSAELIYVIGKFDKQIEELRLLGLTDKALEERRAEHYERLLQSWGGSLEDSEPEE